MPNWCNNKIETSKKVMKSILNKDKEVDFNIVAPMPPHQPDLLKPNPFWRENLNSEQEKSFGKENCWYDWSYTNWGVKWNASETLLSKDAVEFDTPWGPPLVWFEKLCELHPKEDITMYSFEPGVELSSIAYSDGEGNVCIDDYPYKDNPFYYEDEEGGE